MSPILLFAKMRAFHLDDLIETAEKELASDRSFPAVEFFPLLHHPDFKPSPNQLDRLLDALNRRRLTAVSQGLRMEKENMQGLRQELLRRFGLR